MASRILGFIREWLLAQHFLILVVESWVLAFRFPNLLRRLCFEGAIGNGLSEELRNNPQFPLGVYFWQFFWGGALVAGLQWAALTTFGRVEFSIALPFSVYSLSLFVSAFLVQAQQARSQWKTVSGWPVIFNVFLILSTLLAIRAEGFQLEVLAWGLALAGLAQVIWLLQKLEISGSPQLPQWSFLKQSLTLRHRVFFLGFGFLQIINLLQTLFLYRYQQGASSTVYWTERFMEVPLGVLSTAVVGPLLYSSEESWQGVWHSVKKTLLLMAPVALVFLFLSDVIASIFLKHGKSEFLFSDLSFCLKAHALTLIPVLLTRILLTQIRDTEEMRRLEKTTIFILLAFVGSGFWQGTVAVSLLRTSTFWVVSAHWILLGYLVWILRGKIFSKT